MIEIHYKCHCLKQEATVWVKPRGDTEDIRLFMDRAARAISEDHRGRSPLCQSATMEYAKIPASDSGVGRRL